LAAKVCFPSKADIPGRESDVRFVPITDIAASYSITSSARFIRADPLTSAHQATSAA
jgi:hypothetical protein